MIPMANRRSLRSWLGILVSVSALSACSVPPSEVYVAGSARGEGGNLDLGANSAKEACTLQMGGADARIYCGAYLQAAGRVTQPAHDTDTAGYITNSPWRLAFDRRFQCEAPTGTTVLDSPGLSMACTWRQGGFAQVVLATKIDGKLYVADGVKATESVLPRAIGVMSKRLPAMPAPKKPDDTGVDTQREAEQALKAEGAGAIAEVEKQMSRGGQENRKGNYAASETAYRTAVQIQERLVKRGANDPALAVPLARQALQVSNQGRFEEANRLFTRAERLAALPDQIDPIARPLTAHLKALNQINRNKPADALALLDIAEKGFTVIVPPDALVPRRRSAGGGRSTAEQMADAAADSELLADQSTSDALNGLIEVRRYRAIALTQLGRPSEAAAALASSRALYTTRDPRLAARFYRTVGMIAAASGRQPEADSELGLAVSTFARVQPGSRPLAETQLLQAANLAKQGSYATALPRCREAVAVLTALKVGVSPAQVVPCLHALSLEVERNPADTQAVFAEMFSLSQLAQGSITSRQIAVATARLAEGARDPKVADAIRRRDAAADLLERLYRQRADLGVEKENAAAFADLEDKIKKAREVQEDAGEALQAASPGFAGLVQESIKTRDAQATLQPNEALAAIVLGEDEGWTILLRNDRITAGRIEGGSKKIDALVKRFRTGMVPNRENVPPPFDTAAARDLYNAVLAPVADGLQGATTLTVAPTGSLLSIPFGALLTGPTTGSLGQAPFLIRRYAVSHVPSVASFVNLRQAAKSLKATRPWFGMGDFRPPTARQATATFPAETCGESARFLASFPSLPGTRRELEASRQLLSADTGDQLLAANFTAKNVLSAPLKNYKVLHFATHAVLPSEIPCQAEPAILTSTDANAANATGALLSATQVAQMDLDAELVILSACNTGGPNGGGAGESLSGLARSFFFAGARAMMVTHWEAHDATITYLTALFLNVLQTNPDGGPAVALATAQRKILDQAEGNMASLGHPYYWSVAALIGGKPSKAEATVAEASPSRVGG